jgi:hypothetical protein
VDHLWYYIASIETVLLAELSQSIVATPGSLCELKYVPFLLLFFSKADCTLPMYLWEYVDDLNARSNKTLI